MAIQHEQHEQHERGDIEHFERWSRTYDDSLLQRLFFERVHRIVLDRAAGLGEPGTVLDIGCGTGRLLRAAQLRWPAARLIGVDPTAGMLRVARERTPGATFHEGKAEALPLPDASVDLALSTTSFHHWNDHVAGVREVRRVLRPGGHFILADFSLPRWLKPLIRHSAAPDRAGRQAIFTQAGLLVLSQDTVLGRNVLVTVAARPTDNVGG